MKDDCLIKDVISPFHSSPVQRQIPCRDFTALFMMSKPSHVISHHKSEGVPTLKIGLEKILKRASTSPHCLKAIRSDKVKLLLRDVYLTCS